VSRGLVQTCNLVHKHKIRHIRREFETSEEKAVDLGWVSQQLQRDFRLAVSNRSAAKQFGSRRIQVGNQASTQASFAGIKPSQR